MFTKLGQISFPAGTGEDRIMEAALEAGADDIASNEDGSIDVLTAVENFPEVRDALRAMNLEPEQAEVTMRPSTSVSLSLEDAQNMIKLLETLEDHDDVQQVYSNADIADDILAELN